jgi:hypothetical protein
MPPMNHDFLILDNVAFGGNNAQTWEIQHHLVLSFSPMIGSKSIILEWIREIPPMHFPVLRYPFFFGKDKGL